MPVARHRRKRVSVTVLSQRAHLACREFSKASFQKVAVQGRARARAIVLQCDVADRVFEAPRQEEALCQGVEAAGAVEASARRGRMADPRRRPQRAARERKTKAGAQRSLPKTLASGKSNAPAQAGKLSALST